MKGGTPRTKHQNGPTVVNSNENKIGERASATMETLIAQPELPKAQPPFKQPVRSVTPGLTTRGVSLPSSAIPSRSQSATPGPISVIVRKGGECSESPDLFRSTPPCRKLRNGHPSRDSPDHGNNVKSLLKLTEASIDADFSMASMMRDYSPERDSEEAQRNIERLQAQLKKSRVAHHQLEQQYQAVIEENKYLKLQASNATDNLKIERKQLRYGIHRAVYNVVMADLQMEGEYESTAYKVALKEIEDLKEKLAEAEQQVKDKARRRSTKDQKLLLEMKEENEKLKRKLHERKLHESTVGHEPKQSLALRNKKLEEMRKLEPGYEEDEFQRRARGNSQKKGDQLESGCESESRGNTKQSNYSDISEQLDGVVSEQLDDLVSYVRASSDKGKPEEAQRAPNRKKEPKKSMTEEFAEAVQVYAGDDGILDEVEAQALFADAGALVARRDEVEAQASFKSARGANAMGSTAQMGTKDDGTLNQVKGQASFENGGTDVKSHLSGAAAQRVFDTFDKNDDGVLDDNERAALMEASARKLSKEGSTAFEGSDKTDKQTDVQGTRRLRHSATSSIDERNTAQRPQKEDQLVEPKARRVVTLDRGTQTTRVKTAAKETQTTLQFEYLQIMFEQLYFAFKSTYTKNVSPWEFMERWALRKEFEVQAAQLAQTETSAALTIQRNYRRRRLRDLDDDALVPGVHQSAFLMALERKKNSEGVDDEMLETQIQVMREGYDKAFIEAGGVRGRDGHACLSEPDMKRAKAIKDMIVELKKARTMADRQTHGFETMGLDTLLAESQKKNSKMTFEVERLAMLTGGEVKIGSVKSRGRARVKAKRKYGNDFSCLTDCMRASIFFPSVGAVYDALEFIIRQEGTVTPDGTLEFRDEDRRKDFYFLDIEDRVLNDVQGYRDVIMKMVVDGLVGELQLHLAPLLTAKGGAGHKIYETLRLAGEFLLESSIRGDAKAIESLASLHNLNGEEAKEKNGRTGLHYCCYHGLMTSVWLLASPGTKEMEERGKHKKVANVWRGDTTSDDHGCLALELALEMGHVEVVTTMLRFMKDRPPQRKVWSAALRRFAEYCILFWVDYAAGAASVAPKDNMTQEAAKEEEKEEETEEDNGFFSEEENFEEEQEKPLPIFKQLLEAGKIEEREKWIKVGRLMLEVLKTHDENREEEAKRSLALVEERLRIAAKAGHTERVHAFLAMGVDCIGDSSESQGTALDLAIENQHAETAAAIAEFLGFEEAEKACRRPVSVSGTFTPCPSAHLYEAALQEDRFYALAAMAARADPNNEDDKTHSGKTPLMVFAAAGDLDMCKFLVKSGSSASSLDKANCKASHYARALGHTEVVKFLKNIEGPPSTGRTRPRDLFSDVAFSGCAGPLWLWVTEQIQDAEKYESKFSEQSKEKLKVLVNTQANTQFKPSALLIATRMSCCEESTSTMKSTIRTQDPSGQVCRAMIMLDADPSIADRDGVTPLHQAARSERMDLYSLFVAQLEMLYGKKEAKKLLTRDLVDTMEETPDLIVKEQEIKKMGRDFIDSEHDRQLKQFIFTFWCGWLKTLRGMEWRGLWAIPGGMARIKEQLENSITNRRDREAKGEAVSDVSSVSSESAPDDDQEEHEEPQEPTSPSGRKAPPELLRTASTEFTTEELSKEGAPSPKAPKDGKASVRQGKGKKKTDKGKAPPAPPDKEKTAKQLVDSPGRGT